MTGSTDTVQILRGRTEAEAHVGVVCFKQGPPQLIGAELEWLLADVHDPLRPPALAEIARALGDHAPSSINPASPARNLPGGSFVTIEPGGQVELSSAPYPDVDTLCSALVADAAQLARLLEPAGFRLKDGAADESRPPLRQLMSPRYCAMEEAFNEVGPFGRLMMCSTAAVQVSVDAGGSGAEMAARWAFLHEAGPALVAAFACSPRLQGAPAGRWASQRMRAWLELDPCRTQAPPMDAVDPAGAYAGWALDVPLLCVRRGEDTWSAPAGGSFADWVEGRLDSAIGRPPTPEDLDYHLSTLFPPVRAHGHFEVRYLDAQPGTLWQVPIVLLGVLLADESTVDSARAIVAGTQGRWRDAAQRGLEDRPLREAAAALLELGATRLTDPTMALLLSQAADRVSRRRTPNHQMEEC